MKTKKIEFKNSSHYSPLMAKAKRIEGRIAPPLILWFLGVPGGLCLLLWLFFFRGH